ncbi:hypothetical protein JCM8097_002368 [Rhodosporidiobolus ruineniae]
MLFNRLAALSLFGLATSVLASHDASAGHNLTARDDALFASVDAYDLSASSDDLLSFDDEELERRAFDELTSELLALPETSANDLTNADFHELDKRCPTCSASASVSVDVELSTAFATCTKKVKTLHTRIKSGVKKCGKKPSAIRVVAAVKAEIRELRVAITALGKVCLKVAAKRSKSGLTVKIVGRLLVSLLVAVHACLAEIIVLIKVAPLLVVLLAGELLALSAQLVILCNALFGLLGHQLKVYVAGALHSSVLVGFRSLGFSSSSFASPASRARASSHGTACKLTIALSSCASSNGHLTPVLRSVQQSFIFDLASQIAFPQSLLSPALPSASAAPMFPPEHQGTPTLTLSNVGVVGGRTTHPVVPPTGQLAIGAVGRVRVEPRFRRGEEEGRARRVAAGLEEEGGEGWQVEPRLVLDATFSADHRVVDGVELARLVETWKRIVEEPSRLLA